MGLNDGVGASGTDGVNEAEADGANAGEARRAAKPLMSIELTEPAGRADCVPR